MTTPELPPLRRYEFCLRGYENTMKRDDDGEYCWDEDREARERILREALDFQAALVKELLPYQVEAVRSRSRIAELEAALAGCVDLAEWWINHKRDPRMSESAYRAWLSLGHRSDSLLRAKAAIDAARKSP